MLGHCPAHVYIAFGHSTSWGDLVTEEAARVDKKLTTLTGSCLAAASLGSSPNCADGLGCKWKKNTFGRKKPRGSAGSLSDPSRKDSGSLGATCVLTTRIERG